MTPKHIILTLLIMLCPIGMAAQSTITRNKPKRAVTKPKPAVKPKAKPKAKPKVKPKPAPRRNNTSHSNNTNSTTGLSAEQNTTQHSNNTNCTGNLSTERVTTPHSDSTSSTGNLSTEQVTTPHSNNASSTSNLSTEQVNTPHSGSTSNTAGLSAELNKLINNMVYVSGGTFTMGGTSEQGSEAYDDEKPTHSVTLCSYYICKYEVTQALWRAVMGSNPSYHKGDNLPVEWVSWNDCQTFINRLNNYTGRNFRLPTEAEWEFAARGGNYSRHYKYSGSNYISDVAWYCDNSGNRTHPVGTKQANELGLYDMSGNVWEWCSDRYGSYSSYSQSNPTGATSGFGRVERGGNWCGLARYCCSSHRSDYAPGNSFDDLGLRLVLSQL